VLGIGALGNNAIIDGLWGVKGEKLDVIDNLVGVLYPGDARKGKTPLLKVTFKLLANIINRNKPAEVPPPPSYDALALMFGPNIARALDKRPWMAHELARLHREAVEREVDQDAGDADGEAEAEEEEDRMDTTQ